MAIIWFLIVGGILSLFDLDYHLTKAFNEWTGKNVSTSSYWAFWFLLGVFNEIIRIVQS